MLKSFFSFSIFYRWMLCIPWAKTFLWLLGLISVSSGIATYFISLTYLSFFLISSATFLIFLAFLIFHRILLLWLERRKGLAGSKLHIRVVRVFSLLVVTPTVIMALFSIFFLHLGMQAWFNEKVQTALQESLTIAKSYLEEHQKVIIQSVREIKRELEDHLEEFLGNPKKLDTYLTNQAHLRFLSEAIVFYPSGRVVGRSFFSLSLEFEDIRSRDLEAAQDDVVIYPNQRHDRVIALVQVSEKPELYLLVSHLVEQKVLERITATQQAVNAYQQLLDERSTVAFEFAFIFSMVTLLMLLLAVWGGVLFANQLINPIARLIDAAEKIRKGDLSTRVTTISKIDELETLGEAFNKMVTTLSGQTKALVSTNHELEDRKQFMENVLKGISSAVLSLDAQGTILLANTMALQFFEHQEKNMIGKPLSDIAPQLDTLFKEALQQRSAVFEKQIALEHHGQFFTLRVLVRGAKTLGISSENVVMTFDDVTELLSAQRKAAWSDVARLIAHEIKNPLTPIQLSAERLKRRYLKQIENDPETFQTCVETIIRQVDYIGQMIGEFSSFARMPEPVMGENDLTLLCKQTLFLQQEAFPDIAFVFSPTADPIEMVCDSHQMMQVLTNLLKNAAESIETRLKTDPSPSGEIKLNLSQDPETITVTIEDNGIGFPESFRERLTEPYITTKQHGTGLGLAIVKKIVEDHQGTLFLRDRKDSTGAQVILVFKKQVYGTS